MFIKSVKRNQLHIFLLVICLSCAQYAASQTFELHEGDTINCTDKNGVKYGFWRYYWPDGDLKYEVFYENNSSNALIYSLLCGGIIGFALLLAKYYFLSSELLKLFSSL